MPNYTDYGVKANLDNYVNLSNDSNQKEKSTTKSSISNFTGTTPATKSISKDGIFTGDHSYMHYVKEETEKLGLDLFEDSFEHGDNIADGILTGREHEDEATYIRNGARYGAAVVDYTLNALISKLGLSGDTVTGKVTERIVEKKLGKDEAIKNVGAFAGATVGEAYSNAIDATADGIEVVANAHESAVNATSHGIEKVANGYNSAVNATSHGIEVVVDTAKETKDAIVSVATDNALTNIGSKFGSWLYEKFN